MYARFGGEDELESFYKVFSLNMRDLGTPVYSKSFFKNILREFPESSRICTVYTRDGQPAASGFLVGFKDILEIPWASSLRSYNSYSPNMLLYWEVLKFACEKAISSLTLAAQPRVRAHTSSKNNGAQNQYSFIGTIG